MSRLGLRLEAFFLAGGLRLLPAAAGFLVGAGFHGEIQFRRDVVMELDRHFVVAGALDRAFEVDLVAVDFDAAEFGLDFLGDVARGDRAESLAGFAGGERDA